MTPIRLLVLSNPAADHLRLLDGLEQPVEVTVSDDLKTLAERAADADVILVGTNEGSLLRPIFPLAGQARWIHSLSAGVEKVTFPELADSTVALTNGKGIFSPSLAEFAIGAILFFAKDFRALVRNQEAGKWVQFDIEMIRDRVLGVVGFGDIGRESARLAHALGMQVVAARRRTELSAEDRDLKAVYPPDRLREMLSICDYVLIALPLTGETRGMIGESELAAMKSTAVILNVGRGPVIVEPALIAALMARRIRGAALDVFDQEPLPDGHPFYRLDNVLLSPHSADHTVGWADLGMKVFLDNFARFRRGEALRNLVDKKAGY